MHRSGTKRSDDKFLIEMAVKTTKQKLFDKGLFDICDIVQEVIKRYKPLDKVNEKRRHELDPINDAVVIQRLYP